MKYSAVVFGLSLPICLQSHAQTPAAVPQELAAVDGRVDGIVAAASNGAGRRMEHYPRAYWQSRLATHSQFTRPRC